ncbi:hypothetical protein ASG89_26225 [Paenibacillus sp. Soil766]|uniref:thiol-disulfide oxidoreductase DCC family protein n=1 Tax=Paenibacillus sp. Soil766 TaxID=1736404 RepID=UPI0007088F28|nr:thiol-disulfide oxidoreductase DCC family protein [Paenibacillus sp. Soil766]KRF01104.1 hypothetical protein ASG89_26225 [Paenibacillus sp. Soil766]
MSHQNDHPSIILFDGVCLLCSSSVQFILRNDPKGVFHFASLQSEFGHKLLAQHKLPVDQLSTIVLIEGDRAHTRTTAALRIARRLRGAWPLTYAAIVIPAPIRNLGYNFIACNRYRWFGKSEQCMLPRPEHRARFLD